MEILQKKEWWRSIYDKNIIEDFIEDIKTVFFVFGAYTYFSR